MTHRWLLAALHLLALGIGLGAVWARSRSLREPLDEPGLAKVFAADTWWGVAAALWLATGLVRFLSSIEKGMDYYVHNPLFLLKMAGFVLIVLLELGPMIGLIRWRMALKRGVAPDTTRAAAYARISTIQTVIVVLLVFAATGVARGLGAP